MNSFKALADPKRRQIMELLGNKGKMTASQIYSNFEVTDSAISQHLKILKKSKLIRVEKKAQQRVYQINQSAVLELQHWVEKLTAQVEVRFEILDQLLEEEKVKLLKE